MPSISELRAVLLALLFAALPALALPAQVARLDKTELSAADFENLLRQVEQSGDRALLAQAHALRCHRLVGSEPAHARAIAEAGLAIARPAQADQALGGLLGCRAYLLQDEGQSDAALKDYDASIEASDRAGDRAQAAQTRALRGELLHARGDYAAALRDLQAAYRTHAELGNEPMQRYDLNAIGNLYADARVAQFDQALDYFRQVLASNEAAGNAAGTANGHFNIASTLERKGDLAAAEAEFRLALAAYEAQGDAESIAETQRAMAALYLRMDKANQALPLAEAAAAHAASTGNLDTIARTRTTRGAALRQLDRSDEAIADLDAAYRYFLAQDNPRYLEYIAGERALAHAGRGDWETAYRARSEQLALGARLDQQLDEELTSRLRVQFDSERKEQENAALQREAALRAASLADAERIRRLQWIVIALAMLLLVAIGLRARQSARAARSMRTLAMTDELTTLPNRRAILARLQARLEAPDRGEVGVLMLDIDHFKAINDRLGHDVGDRVLRTVADTVRHALGRDGELGRIGGEEFLVVLAPGQAGERAAIAERLRQAVDDRARAAAGADHAVSISLGGCVAREDERRVEDVLKRADVALYRAKEGGRNRAVLDH